MIGVVVWTDQELGKAVIWCEDQNDLAYYVRSKSEHSTDNTQGATQVELNVDPHVGADTYVAFREGDLVTFDSYYEGRCRMARSLSLLEEETHSQLADLLQDEPKQQESETTQRPTCQGAASINVQQGISASVTPLRGMSQVQDNAQHALRPKKTNNVVSFKAASRKLQVG